MLMFKRRRNLTQDQKRGLSWAMINTVQLVLFTFQKLIKLRKKVRRVVFTNEFLQVSEDVNQVDYCDDDNYHS